MSKKVFAALIFNLIFLGSSAFCDETSAVAKKAAEQPCEKITPEETSVTQQTVKLLKGELKYQATAGTMHLKDNGGHPKASIFYIAYVKEGVKDKAARPITFCFNGGPGSSSVWLHLGVLGPKRLVFDEAGYPVTPNQLVDNEYTLLETSDLVFIDPVSTGYSRTAPGEDPKQYHGVDEDIKAVAEFIRIYVTRNDRWDSPKYLAGESYGTTRAAGLAGHLHDKQHLYLNGVMLISSVLNFQTVSFSQPGNDLPYLLFLPTYTATAWYHKKLAPELQKDRQVALKEAQDFALHEYAQALMAGDLLGNSEKEKVVQKLARLTGLTPEYIDRSHLRVNIYRFTKELLRNQDRTVGRFDSRMLGMDSDSCGETFEYDPSFDAIIGAFTAAFNTYIREDLNWKKDDEYVIIADVGPWNYGSATNQFLNVGETLRSTMTKNPLMKVFVGSGYYDLATPYFTADYTFTHLGLDPSLRDHVEMKVYDGGHMMYTLKDSLIQLSNDLKRFMQTPVKNP